MAYNSPFGSAAAVGGPVAYQDQDVPFDDPYEGYSPFAAHDTKSGISADPSVYSCAHQHPVNALKALRPDSKMEMIASYSTHKGSALIYTADVDGVTYQGEATTGAIAKAIVATKALAGINAFGHEQVRQMADYIAQKKLVMERISDWKELQDGKQMTKEQRMEAQANKKKKENSGDATPIDSKEAPGRPRSRDYGVLLNKYGPDVSIWISTSMDTGYLQFICDLEVQGFAFVGTGSSKKEAKYMAIVDAFEALELSPPPVVNEKRRKLPQGQLHGDPTFKLLDYGVFNNKYGPDISLDITESEERRSLFICKLLIQGLEFSGQGPSKKSAKNQAYTAASEAFEINPPPVVNSPRRRQNGRNRVDRRPFEPMEPIEFEDKLAEKCWKFVSEKLADVPTQFTARRNLVVMVKVKGDELLDNCEIVSFGSGSLCIKKDNMTAEGDVINDSTGDSLALRAFRRYLLDQIELSINNDKTSIYQKDAGDKFMLKQDIAFYMYTNNAPVGDCRARISELHPNQPGLDKELDGDPTVTPSAETPPADPPAEQTAPTPDPTMETESIIVKTEVDDESGDTPMPSTDPNENDKQRYRNRFGRKRGRRVEYRNRPRFLRTAEDLGKIQIYSMHPHGSSESTFIKFEDAEKKHCIISPSDKLAIRQMVGVQGSMLSLLSDPIYISSYLVNRSYNEEMILRGLYNRVAGASPDDGLEPTLSKVNWYCDRTPGPRSRWSFLWAKEHSLEFIYVALGQQIDPNAMDSVELDPDDDPSAAPSAAPSVYCTRSLYSSFSDICNKAKKAVQPYSEIKRQAGPYQALKKLVKEHLEKTGMGTWPEKPFQPAF